MNSKSLNTFNKIYDQIIRESNMTGGEGSVWGDLGAGHGGDFGNSDWYASGDSRNIFGVSGKKKKKHKKFKIHRRKIKNKL